MVKHIILDTDIGYDPDDAFALLLALCSEEILLDLVVTSDEHLGHKAAFARMLLQSMKKDIPVIKGSDLGNANCVVCDFVSGVVRKGNVLSTIKNIVENNSRTYYVCIGPQTNLTTFLECVPELKSKMDVVIMGGAINYRRKGMVEHNVRQDVRAARKVFNSDINMRWVLSDTTYKAELRIDRSHEIYKRMVRSNMRVAKLLLKNCQNFFRKVYPETYMHDPLTLSCIINPKFVRFGRKRLGMDEKGIMHLCEDGKELLVSTDADYEKFMEFLSERLPF